MRTGQPNRLHCPFPLEWKDQAANVGALERISTEVEAKFKGGTAYCTRSLFSDSCQKKKRGFKKHSDLFDYFVVSVLKLRIFYVYFKIRKSWDYIRGYPSTTQRNLCLLEERLKPEFALYSKHVLRRLWLHICPKVPSLEEIAVIPQFCPSKIGMRVRSLLDFTEVSCAWENPV